MKIIRCINLRAITLFGAALFMAAGLLPGCRANASQPAMLTIADAPLTKGIARIGVNLENWTNYGAEQFSSNVIMNPGFEPTVDRAIVIVKTADASGFEDNADWLARPDGFWDGGSFEVLSGAAAGQSGRIAASTTRGGFAWFQTTQAAPQLAPGDAISVTRVQRAGVPANWWVQGDSKGLVAIDQSQHPANTSGDSSAKLSLRSGAATELDSYLAGHQRFLPITGRWRLSFWTRGTDGASLAVSFARITPPTAKIFVATNVAVAPQWKLTTADFDGRDGAADGPLKLSFAATGPASGSVWLTNVELGRIDDLKRGPWRSELIDTLRQLHPGYLRDLQSQLGDTLANRLAPIFARGPQRFVPDPGDTAQSFMYSVPDFLALCHTVGAQPWIVAPTTFYRAEFSGLGSYLAQAQAHYHFSEIVVEFGNENWNGVFRAAGIQNPLTMAQAANQAFKLLRQAAGPSTPLHLEINGQYAYTGPGGQALTATARADAVDVAPYYFYTLNATDPQEQALHAMLNPDDESRQLASLRTIARKLSKDIDIYEVNLSTTEGDAPPAQRNRYVAGMISGVSLANRLLEGMYAGVTRQLIYNLAQHEYGAHAGPVKLWGVTEELGMTGNFRPTGLALEMLNQAIEGDFYPVSFDEHGDGIRAAAFRSSRGWALALVSTNPVPLALLIKWPHEGARPAEMLSLSAANIFADNEERSEVSIHRSKLPPDADHLTVPGYGLIVLLPAGPT